jgi:hypothetical protein
MIDISRVAVVFSSAAAPMVAGNVFDDEHVRFTAMLVSTVAVVAGLIAWIDRRIEKRIKDHANQEEAVSASRHTILMGEIRHLRIEMRLPEDREITDSAGRPLYR